MSKVKILIFYSGNKDSAIFVNDYSKNILPKVKKYQLDIAVMDARKLSRQQLNSLIRYIEANVFPFAIVNDGTAEKYYPKKAQIYEIISDECLKVKNAMQQSKKGRTGRTSSQVGGGQGVLNESQLDDYLVPQQLAGVKDASTEKEEEMQTGDTGSQSVLNDSHFSRHDRAGGKSFGSSAARNNIANFGTSYDDDSGTDGMSSDLLNNSMSNYDDSEHEIREMLSREIIDPGSAGSESKVAANVGDSLPRMRF